MDGLSCEVATSFSRSEWNSVAAEDPLALTEQLPDWIDAMVASKRFRDASRLYRFDDGRRFVLPLAAKWGAAGPQHGFPSGWGIGGPVGADLDSEVATAILADLAQVRALYVHVRPNPLHGELWASANSHGALTVDRRAHVVDLSGGADGAWSRFRKSGRRGVKKAQTAGLDVTVHSGGEMLDVYYNDLFLRSVERWASRQHEPLALARFRATRRDPLARLELISRCLGSRVKLYMAWQDGTPVAGNIVLWGPQNAHATRGASNYELAHETRAFYLLDWTAISDACDAGFGTYHLGESGQNASLSEYKERFGAKPHEYCEYRFERLPLLATDTAARSAVKRVIGFQDH